MENYILFYKNALNEKIFIKSGRVDILYLNQYIEKEKKIIESDLPQAANNLFIVIQRVEIKI